MMISETAGLGRTRLLIVAALAFTAVITAVRIWSDRAAGGGASTAGLVAITLTAVVSIGAAVVFIVGLVRSRRRDRPVRLEVTGRGFGARAVATPLYLILVPLLNYGSLLASMIDRWTDTAEVPDTAMSGMFVLLDIVMAGMFVLLTAVLVPVVVLAWRGDRLDLTPHGITLRKLLLPRDIPWEALAPHGPRRSGPGDHHLAVAVARPELVARRVWMIGNRDPRRVLLPLTYDVHPHFLADAIRWYVERPDERPAIGTADGYGRLVAALTGGSPGSR